MSVTIESPVVASVIPRTLQQRVERSDEISSAISAVTEHSSWREVLRITRFVVGEMKAGERFQVRVPRNYSHCIGSTCHDEDNIAAIHKDVHTLMTSPDIFAVVRFIENSSSDVMVDIARM